MEEKKEGMEAKDRDTWKRDGGREKYGTVREMEIHGRRVGRDR